MGLLLAAVFCYPLQGIMWDGGFQSQEFRLTFIDQNGQPVEGVSIQVQTQAGGTTFFYPVNEFTPEMTLVSNAAGRMEFHHVGQTIEFGGHEYDSIIGLRFGETKAPQYVCVFLLNNKEVARMPFDSLRVNDSQATAFVRRHWSDPEWPRQIILKHFDHWQSFRKSFFDSNRDGRLDREESTAARSFEVRSDLERKDLDEEVEFMVVEKTITLQIP